MTCSYVHAIQASPAILRPVAGELSSRARAAVPVRSAGACLRSTPCSPCSRRGWLATL